MLELVLVCRVIFANSSARVLFRGFDIRVLTKTTWKQNAIFVYLTSSGSDTLQLQFHFSKIRVIHVSTRAYSSPVLSQIPHKHYTNRFLTCSKQCQAKTTLVTAIAAQLTFHSEAFKFPNNKELNFLAILGNSSTSRLYQK